MNGRNGKGQFAEGNPGRPAGTPNKQTIDIKEIVNEILDYVRTNDFKDWMGQIKEEKPEVFLNFVAKIAPKDLTVNVEEKESRFLKAVEEAKKERDG